MFSFRRRPAPSLLGVILFLLMVPTALVANVAFELVPASAPLGARAIISGTGLDAANIAVSFTAAGGAVPATIVSRSANLLEIVVPPSAGSGPVTVTSGGTTLASLGFTLLPDPPFVTVTTLAASVQAHNLFQSPSGVAVATTGGFSRLTDNCSRRSVRVIRAW